MASKKELTAKQEAFLNALFDEAKGDFRAAMTIAGYAATTPISVVAKALKEEIREQADLQLTITAPKASMSFGSVIDDPTMLGAKEKLLAAKEVLDRVGLVKIDKTEVAVSAPNGLFILPTKN